MQVECESRGVAGRVEGVRPLGWVPRFVWRRGKVMHRGGTGMIKYVAFALAIVVALPACASDWDWDMRSGSPTANRGRVAYYHRKHHPRPRVMAYERRSVERAERQDEDGGGKCVEKVRGLGTQWIGTKGALDAAKKDWMERVRYDHGES